MKKPVGPVRHMTAEPVSGAILAKCPVEVAIAPISGKWKSVILWHLSEPEAALRFTELHARLDGIGRRMLARQLRELEADGLVWRDVYPVTPPRVEYGLTPRGRSLRPILDAMCAWGKDHGWKGP